MDMTRRRRWDKLSILCLQIQKEGDELYLLHWDGRITLFSVEEMLSQRPNDELMNRCYFASKLENSQKF